MLLASLLLWTGGGAGKVFLTTDEALRLAFPECRVERQTHYLNDTQLAKARELALVDVPGAVVTAYRATDRDGRYAGTAYFDSHVVRTQAETLMLVVGTDGKLRRVEVLSFDEPLEYLPKGAWYAQFRGRGLDSELHLKRGVPAVTGASLTARATTEAARRTLARHAVLYGAGAP